MRVGIDELKRELKEKISQLEVEQHELLIKIKAVETRLSEARGGLEVLHRVEEQQAARSTESLLRMPAISLAEAVRKATVALKQFTRTDLQDWIHSNYPQIKFSDKSVDGAMRRLMAEHKVVMLRANTGNKLQAVYGVQENEVKPSE